MAKHHEAHHEGHHMAHGGHAKGHHGHHHRKHKAKGGGIAVAGGNPKVIEEADKKKRGGRAKEMGHMHGHHPKHRLDRPGRKRGGRVGSNRSPLSTAHSSGGIGKQPDTQEGGMSD